MQKSPSDFKLDPAIVALRMLFYEGSTGEDRNAYVWMPTKAVLSDLAKTPAHTPLTCFHSPVQDGQFRKQPVGTLSSIFIVNKDNEVFYLGAVGDKQYTDVVWRNLLQRHAREPERLQQLKQSRARAPLGLVSLPTARLIPSASATLTETVIDAATRRAIGQLEITLADRTLEWLSGEDASFLFQTIVAEAKASATQSQQEVIQRFAEDFHRDR